MSENKLNSSVWTFNNLPNIGQRVYIVSDGGIQKMRCEKIIVEVGIRNSTKYFVNDIEVNTGMQQSKIRQFLEFDIGSAVETFKKLFHQEEIYEEC